MVGFGFLEKGSFPWETEWGVTGPMDEQCDSSARCFASFSNRSRQ
jgi:hypothetical protein